MKKPVLAICLLMSPLVVTAESEEKLSGDSVLLSRGNAEITVNDFEAALMQVPEKHREGAARDLSVMEKLLGQLLENRLLAARARETDLNEDPVVKAGLRQAQEKFLATRQVERVLDSAPEADFEQMAREHYLANKDEFQAEPRISVRHVLIATEDRGDEEARSLAAEVAEKARSGADFGNLVREYSDDPGADDNDGFYRDMNPGNFAKPFADAAMALEEGEVSDPVKTRYGYHVIRLEDYESERIKPFKDVKRELIGQMRERHAKRVRDDYLKEVLEDTEPKLNEEVLKSLNDRYRNEVPVDE